MIAKNTLAACSFVYIDTISIVHIYVYAICSGISLQIKLKQKSRKPVNRVAALVPGTWEQGGKKKG